MKKMYSISTLPGIVLLLSISLGIQAQTDNKAATTKKLEAAVTAAKNNLAKNEKMLALSDSLIETGTKLVNDAKVENKAIATDRKKTDKDYALAKKTLDKQVGSKDKEEAAKAKTDLKALDTKYRADVKNLDNRLKVATKNTTTGTTNVNKGKTSKKTAEDGIKSAKTALATAEAKLNAYTNPPEAAPADKKKKK
jgi:hypothetical protein